MVYFIGASSLYQAFTSSFHSVRSPVYNKSTAILGLSLNPRTRNRLKDLRLLLEKGFLKNRIDMVCWHDVINNSLTPHKSNGNQLLSVEQLLEILRKHSQKFAAIIYCQRFGTPNIFDKLRTLNILVVDVKKRLLSKRKQKTPAITNEIRKLHPWLLLEQNFITGILRKSANLYCLVFQKPSRTQKENPKRKRKLANLVSQLKLLLLCASAAFEVSLPWSSSRTSWARCLPKTKKIEPFHRLTNKMTPVAYVTT